MEDDHDHKQDNDNDTSDGEVLVNRAAIEDAIQLAIDQGALVQVVRDSDEHPYWNGFPIALAENRLLLRTVDDFRIDGFAVMGVADITDVRTGEAEAFFTRVLRGEGRLDSLAPPKPILLRSWRTVIESVKAHYRVAIVEFERSDDDFFLGEIVETDADEFAMQYISVDGSRDAAGTRLPYEDMTLVRFDEDYINLFRKYQIAEDQH